MMANREITREIAEAIQRKAAKRKASQRKTAKRKPVLKLNSGDDDDSELLRAGTISDDLGVTEGTLANWRAQRKGPPWVKVGKYPLYPLGDYRRWKAMLPRIGGGNAA
jgi:hypothetical protein